PRHPCHDRQSSHAEQRVALKSEDPTEPDDRRQTCEKDHCRRLQCGTAVGLDVFIDRPVQQRRAHHTVDEVADRGADVACCRRHTPSEATPGQGAACVTVTTLSLTVILPVREEVPVFADTLNATGLSPCCGMLLVTVIQETFDRAVQTHRSCSAPPQLFGTLSCNTEKLPFA